MAKLLIKNANLAGTYGLPATDTDTETLLKDYGARGWKDADTMAHIDAAITAGLYVRETTYPIKQEKVIRQAGATEGEK